MPWTAKDFSELTVQEQRSVTDDYNRAQTVATLDYSFTSGATSVAFETPRDSSLRGFSANAAEGRIGEVLAEAVGEALSALVLDQDAFPIRKSSSAADPAAPALRFTVRVYGLGFGQYEVSLGCPNPEEIENRLRRGETVQQLARNARERVSAASRAPTTAQSFRNSTS